MAFDLGREIFKLQRVLRVARRPREREFYHMAKITISGSIAIGLLGVIISAIFSFI